MDEFDYLFDEDLIEETEEMALVPGEDFQVCGTAPPPLMDGNSHSMSIEEVTPVITRDLEVESQGSRAEEASPSVSSSLDHQDLASATGESDMTTPDTVVSAPEVASSSASFSVDHQDLASAAGKSGVSTPIIGVSAPDELAFFDKRLTYQDTVEGDTFGVVVPQDWDALTADERHFWTWYLKVPRQEVHLEHEIPPVQGVFSIEEIENDSLQHPAFKDPEPKPAHEVIVIEDDDEDSSQPPAQEVVPIEDDDEDSPQPPAREVISIEDDDEDSSPPPPFIPSEPHVSFSTVGCQSGAQLAFSLNYWRPVIEACCQAPSSVAGVTVEPSGIQSSGVKEARIVETFDASQITVKEWAAHSGSIKKLLSVKGLRSRDSILITRLDISITSSGDEALTQQSIDYLKAVRQVVMNSHVIAEVDVGKLKEIGRSNAAWVESHRDRYTSLGGRDSDCLNESDKEFRNKWEQFERGPKLLDEAREILADIRELVRESDEAKRDMISKKMGARLGRRVPEQRTRAWEKKPKADKKKTKADEKKAREERKKQKGS